MPLTPQGIWYPDKDTLMSPLHTNFATLAQSIDTKLAATLLPRPVATTTEINALAVGTPFYNTVTGDFGWKTLAGSELAVRDKMGTRAWGRGPDYYVDPNAGWGPGPLTGHERPEANFGPAPAVPSNEDLVISADGIYYISWAMVMPGVRTGSAPGTLRMIWPYDRPQSAFGLDDLATISRLGFLPKNYIVHFEVFQASTFGRLNAQHTITITRIK